MIPLETLLISRQCKLRYVLSLSTEHLLINKKRQIHGLAGLWVSAICLAMLQAISICRSISHSWAESNFRFSALLPRLFSLLWFLSALWLSRSVTRSLIHHRRRTTNLAFFSSSSRSGVLSEDCPLQYGLYAKFSSATGWAGFHSSSTSRPTLVSFTSTRGFHPICHLTKSTDYGHVQRESELLPYSLRLLSRYRQTFLFHS